MTDPESHAEAVRRIRAVQASGQTWLDLGDLPMVELPEELGACTQLEVLSLGGFKINSKNEGIEWEWAEDRPRQRFNSVDGLRSLANLTALNLAVCKALTSVEALRGLANLTSLDLSWCDALTSVEALRGLANLTSLDLSGCDALTSVEALRELVNLTSLNLFSCKALTSVEALRGLANLTSLDLSWCKALTSVEVLRGLANLTSLKLSGCEEVQEFAPVLEQLDCLEQLTVYGTRFRDLHAGVCGSSQFDNSIESVRQYFAALVADARPDAEIKVFVLGNGRAGKSFLVRRLMGKSYEQIVAEKVPTTHGVQIETYPAPAEWGLPHAVKLCIWDFGGQDIYHGTHALFLRAPAIYLLLFADATENEETIEDGGFVMQNRLLPYWLDYLRQEAGMGGVVNSPVLLVKSQCDRPGPDVAVQRPDEQQFPQLSPIIRTSAVELRGLRHLMPQLEEAIGKLLEAHPQPPLPTTWANVRQAIRDLQQAHEPKTLTQIEFAEMCEQHGCGKNAEVLRDALHIMGAVFCRKGIFGDRIVVDQGWVLGEIYAVSTRHEKFQQQLRRQQGRFTREDLDRHFWSKHPIEDQKLFLSFMVECGICFVASGDTDRDTAEYIAPDMLEPWEKQPGGQVWASHAEKGLGVSVNYGLLHDGIARNFLAKIGTVAKDIPTYWKFGCRFLDATTNSEVLIRTQANTIRLQAWGERPKELLENLLRVLAKVPSGQPSTAVWDDVADEPIVVEVARGRDDRPESAIVASYGAKSVFFSYRHPDANLPGSERSQRVLRELHKLLESQDWVVLFDERDLEQGDSISAFIHQVRACAFFVPVFCGRYFDSRYTLSELFTFREQFAHDATAFADRTMTIAYPESRIWEDLQQAQYVLRCGTMFDEYLDMAGKGALAPQTYQNVIYLKSWAVRLSEILALLNDRLHKPDRPASGRQAQSSLRETTPAEVTPRDPDHA